MDAGQETLTLLNRVWLKLQNLNSADEIQLGAFFIILIFILLVLVMIIVTCSTLCCSCCSCCRKSKGSIN